MEAPSRSIRGARSRPDVRGCAGGGAASSSGGIFGGPSGSYLFSIGKFPTSVSASSRGRCLGRGTASVHP